MSYIDNFTQCYKNAYCHACLLIYQNLSNNYFQNFFMIILNLISSNFSPINMKICPVHYGMSHAHVNTLYNIYQEVKARVFLNTFY